MEKVRQAQTKNRGLAAPDTMKKLFITLGLLCLAVIAIATPGATLVGDHLTEACGSRLKMVVDHLTKPGYQKDDGEMYAESVRQALLEGHFVESEKSPAGYSDVFTKKGNFALRKLHPALVCDDWDTEEHRALFEARVEEAKKYNAVILTMRRQLIEAVLSEYYLDGFVERVITQAVVKQDPAGTIERIKAFRPLVVHCIEYTEKWTDAKYKEELSWLALCETVRCIEQEKSDLFTRRFTSYGPGEWNHESDSKPMTGRAGTRYAEAFIFRRIHTDGMTKEQILKILKAIKIKLDQIERAEAEDSSVKGKKSDSLR